MKPTDISLRPYNAYYLPRPEDEKIRDCIETGGHCCIVGQPLAGKTRAIYEILKNANQPFTVTKPHCNDIKTDSFQLPFPWKWWERFPPTTQEAWQGKWIVFLDDVDKYADKQNCVFLITSVVQNRGIIVASCRSGEELAKASKKLEELFHLFGNNIISLPLISDEQGKEICRNVDKPWYQAGFDGTSGIIFLNPTTMKQRYEGLNPQEKSILQTTRQLYLVGVFEGKEVFSINRIKLVCDKVYGIRDLPQYQWNEWLEKLEQVGFLKLLGRDRIWAEEAYLLKVVEPRIEETQLDLLNTMLTTFKSDAEALFLLGNRAYGSGENSLERANFMKFAIAAYTEALKVRKLDTFPMDYAMTQNNLGVSYRNLA
ncbi:MAG: hypothetical protein AAB037_05420, partial [Chloroflexota bacterium]